MAQQEISSEEVFGIAKRINKELEAFPIYTHSAIVELVTVGKDHRNLVLKAAEMNFRNDQQERIIRLKEFEMQAEQKRQDAAVAQQMGPALVAP